GSDCTCKLVYSKKMKLDIEIEVNIPLDIIEDTNRIKAVEDGLRLSISKGLYEQGVSFKINKISSRLA
ncbi:MAG: hypothetical protein ACJ709_08860, partial [Nitrososphaeraceae archaeon]